MTAYQIPPQKSKHQGKHVYVIKLRKTAIMCATSVKLTKSNSIDQI